MDVKCPSCESVAKLDEEFTRVICSKCGLRLNYDQYMIKMKERVETKSVDYEDSSISDGS